MSDFKNFLKSTTSASSQDLKTFKTQEDYQLTHGGRLWRMMPDLTDLLPNFSKNGLALYYYLCFFSNRTTGTFAMTPNAIAKVKESIGLNQIQLTKTIDQLESLSLIVELNPEQLSGRYKDQQLLMLPANDTILVADNEEAFNKLKIVLLTANFQHYASFGFELATSNQTAVYEIYRLENANNKRIRKIVIAHYQDEPACLNELISMSEQIDSGDPHVLDFQDIDVTSKFKSETLLNYNLSD